MALSQPAPSWIDPASGMIVVPPAKPETPEEIAAVPDAVPATVPFGYERFMMQKKMQAYEQRAEEDQAQQEMEQKQAEVQQEMEIEEDIEEQRNQIASIYGTTDGGGAFYEDIMGKVEKAKESDDSYKVNVANETMDYLNDPQTAQEISEYFNSVPEDMHDDMSQQVTRHVISKIKSEYDGDDRKSEPGSNWQSKSREALDNINEMLDDSNPYIENFSKARKTPEEISEGGITYRIKKGEYGGLDYDKYNKTKNVNDMLRMEGSNMRIDDPEIFEIDWDVSDSNEKFDTSKNRKSKSDKERRRLALEALKLWREEVLPSLSPGTILFANPMADDEEYDDDGEAYDRRRERIYKMAGFSGSDSRNRQWSVVLQDEDGKNVIKPINDPYQKKTRFEQYESYYVDMFNKTNSSETKELIYEVLAP